MSRLATNHGKSLHHRIGDLENISLNNPQIVVLHHRIGDLEKTVVFIIVNVKLHHRIGDLES